MIGVGGWCNAFLVGVGTYPVATTSGLSVWSTCLWLLFTRGTQVVHVDRYCICFHGIYSLSGNASVVPQILIWMIIYNKKFRRDWIDIPRYPFHTFSQLLRKLWLNRQELAAEDFGSAESSGNGGILYVFPISRTERMRQKICCPAEDDLFRGSP